NDSEEVILDDQTNASKIQANSLVSTKASISISSILLTHISNSL
ncbi:13027_t:CDS:1, partial [Dentiscutata heterogama]